MFGPCDRNTDVWDLEPVVAGTLAQRLVRLHYLGANLAHCNPSTAGTPNLFRTRPAPFREVYTKTMYIASAGWGNFMARASSRLGLARFYGYLQGVADSQNFMAGIRDSTLL